MEPARSAEQLQEPFIFNAVSTLAGLIVRNAGKDAAADFASRWRREVLRGLWQRPFTRLG